MLGGTAGRTTLNGEGLQHQDGHSLRQRHGVSHGAGLRSRRSLMKRQSSSFDGMKRMYEDNETAIYYITLENENYEMPAMPAGVEEGIIKGMYRLRSFDVEGPRVQLLGSGAILNSTLSAAELLASRYGVASDVWSVTSYTQLRREAQECQRWNLLHPGETPRVSYPAAGARRRRGALHRGQ